jgi:stage II sporulation protein D
VAATGHAYRGTIEVRSVGPGALRVVNHVDLDTYVAGIAEEKNAGWPLEGLKTLAVAARSLGAATMTWYGKNRANGYDICPTQNCQVYLGYDGEEPLMRQAVAETAGQIRVYNGTAILAMYHGNGGGQTESYHRVARTTANPHPYLRSIRYPYADPSNWQRETTLTQIAAAVGFPQPIEKIEILERGDSPRVIRLRVVGSDGDRELPGETFARALELRSTWFYLEGARAVDAVVGGGRQQYSAPGTDAGAVPQTASGWPLVVGASALLALAAAAVSRSRTIPGLLGVWPPRRRVALTPSPPGS